MPIKSRKKVVKKNDLGKKFVVLMRYNPSLFGAKGEIPFYVLTGGSNPMDYEDAVNYAKARSENFDERDFYIVEIQAKIERVAPKVEKYRVIKYNG